MTRKTSKDKENRQNSRTAAQSAAARRYTPKRKPGLRAAVKKIRRPEYTDPASMFPTKENNMQENYLISIKGRQKIDGEVGEVELTTLGSYVKRGKSRYIVYQEYAEDDNNTPRTSILKIDGSSRLTLMRKGGDNTRLILENGKRHLCQYDTGYGNMMIGIFTSKMDSELDDAGGSLNVSYTLDINSTLSSMNELFITVKEAKNNDVKN
ncbi:MAG TPA: DUF1934 domain-containing protein [Caproicibacter sp.]|nr:DUF1934 domain-containing protein [Caproicibacter sp.]